MRRLKIVAEDSRGILGQFAKLLTEAIKDYNHRDPKHFGLSIHSVGPSKIEAHPGWGKVSVELKLNPDGEYTEAKVSWQQDLEYFEQVVEGNNDGFQIKVEAKTKSGRWVDWTAGIWED